jgi:hypothetical protein
MATKDAMRPIYAELQGYLSQAPTLDKYVIYSAEVWQHANGTIDELSRISGEDYSRFKITPERDGAGSQRIQIDTYRTKLSGLISRLHGEYFADEHPPFSGMPQTVNILSQQQSQTVYIQMIVDITEQVTRSEADFKEGTKERSFIDKVKSLLKSGMGGITSTAQLILLILNIANQCGLSVADMQRIFGC